MRNLILTTVTAILLLTSCNSGTPTVANINYTKEPLPADFTYKIIEDSTNPTLEKNEMTVEISKKITVEQIATLAERFFSSKPKQRRFYIFYLLPGMKIGASAWATSHYDPELEIQIIGATIEQQETSNKTADAVFEGKVIGKWYEEQYSSSNYVIYKKDSKTFIKIIFDDGQVSNEEMKTKKVNNGIRYDYMDDGYNGEYFIVNLKGELEFYNSENKKFTTATKR